MIKVQETLSKAFDYLMSRLEAHEELRRDRDAALEQFLGGREPGDLTLARFEEWFLFEHTSPRFGDLPPFVTLSETPPTKHLAAGVVDLLDELGTNLYGVFEWSSGDDGFEAQELWSGRTFPIDEEQAEALTESLDRNSLLVGRVFATARGTFVFGRGAAAVEGEVANALRQDLLGRPGDRKARISQLEMEKLLFQNLGRGGGAPEPAAPDGEIEPIERLEAEIETWLRDVTVEGIDVEEIRSRFQAAPGNPAAVSELLDEIAFETEADLDVGRRLLPAYYKALHTQQKPRGGAARRESPHPGAAAAGAPRRERAADELRDHAQESCKCQSGKPYGECCLPKDAVARFEAGRAQGKDLDELIAGLQTAMGIEADDEEDQDSTELPGAPPVGPMVDEYLWECERLGKPQDSKSAETLRALAASIDSSDGAPGDAAEVLPAHIERFVCFDRYRAAKPPTPGSAAAEMRAITNFAIWLRDEQGVDWCEFVEPIAKAEAARGDRIANANALLGANEDKDWNCAFRVTRITRRGDSVEAEVESLRGPVMRGAIALQDSLAGLLEPGDCLALNGDGVRAAGEGSSQSIRLLRILPPEAKAFLSIGTPSQF